MVVDVYWLVMLGVAMLCMGLGIICLIQKVDEIKGRLTDAEMAATEMRARGLPSRPYSMTSLESRR